MTLISAFVQAIHAQTNNTTIIRIICSLNGQPGAVHHISPFPTNRPSPKLDQCHSRSDTNHLSIQSLSLDPRSYPLFFLFPMSLLACQRLQMGHLPAASTSHRSGSSGPSLGSGWFLRQDVAESSSFKALNPLKPAEAANWSTS